MKPHHSLCPWRHVAYTDSCGTCVAIHAAVAEEREAIIASLCHGMQHCEIVKMIRARGGS